MDARRGPGCPPRARRGPICTVCTETRTSPNSRPDNVKTAAHEQPVKAWFIDHARVAGSYILRGDRTTVRVLPFRWSRSRGWHFVSQSLRNATLAERFDLPKSKFLSPLPNQGLHAAAGFLKG